MTNMPKEINWPRWSIDFVKMCEQCPKTLILRNFTTCLQRCMILGWLEVAMPHLDKLFGMPHVPNIYHVENTWDHTMMVTANAIRYMDDPVVAMLAGLYHDTGKYDTMNWVEEKQRHTFYSHEIVSARHMKWFYNTDIPHDKVKRAQRITAAHMLVHNNLSGERMFKLVYRDEVKNDLLDLFLFSVCDSNGRITGENVVKSYQQLSNMLLVIDAWNNADKVNGSDIISGYLFSVSLNFVNELNNNQLTQELVNQFHAYKPSMRLSEDAYVEVVQVGNEWALFSGKTRYRIHKSDDKLKVCTGGIPQGPKVGRVLEARHRKQFISIYKNVRKGWLV
jgi:putative nucleotidyltransferase with HDIG domain